MSQAQRGFFFGAGTELSRTAAMRGGRRHRVVDWDLRGAGGKRRRRNPNAQRERNAAGNV
jgi:hypothetical protein